MVLRHAVRKDIVCRVVITEQVGFLDTKFHFADDDRFVVKLVVVVGSCGIVQKELFAQFSVLAVLKHRSERGTFGCEEPFSRMSSSGSFFCCGRFGRFRKTFQQGFVFHETLAGIGLCHYVITELQREETQFKVDFFESFFFVFRQVRTVVGEGLVGLRHKSHLFGVQSQLFALVVHGFDPLEERIVENNTIAEFAQHRIYFLGDGVHLIVTIRFKDIEEDTGNTVERHARSVQRDDGVVEGWFFGVIHDSLHFRFLFVNSGFESRDVIVQLDLVKCRNGVSGRQFRLLF